MNLIVEIGNTALKAAWTEDKTLGKTFRYQGERKMDFIASITEKEKPGVLVVSSVYEISAADEKRLKGECRRLVILDPAHPLVASRYGFPAYLSYDRAAALLAARWLFKDRGCTVVDFGTTLTIDYIDAEGNYEGGNISLGCRTRFKALNRYSRRLPLVNTPGDPEVYGHSLQGSIEAGVVSGILFEIAGYIEQNGEGVVIFTGGDANYFAKRMKKPIFVICNLVLMGLAIIADEYAK